jgi:hypothetical protein
MKAKKIILITLLLMFVIQSSFSQHEYLIDSDDRFSFANVRMDNNGDYIAIFNRDSADRNFKGGMVKFNKHFDYEMYLHENDSTYFVFWDFIVTDDNNYLIAGTIGDNVGWGIANHTIYFLLLDENLTVIAENSFPLPEAYNNPFIKMLKNIDGRIYVTIDEPSGIMKGVIELSPDAQILKEQMYFDMGSPIVNPFPSHGHGFYLLRSLPVPWALGGITAVDTCLNFDTTYVFPMKINGIYYDMDTRGTCKWLNDTTYILCADGSLESATDDLYLYKVSSEHQFLTEPFIIGRDDFDDMVPNFQGMDWVDPQNIWVAGTVWFSMYHQTPYYVAIINEDFEVLGTKSCGGDNNTFIHSILATSDGGCVMVGGQRDYQAGNQYDTDGYIAFFEPEDIITSANETANPYDSDYLLYPNPGYNQLNIQTARKGVVLKMYDQLGHLVLLQMLNDEFRNQVGTGPLKTGFYICQLTDKDGNIEHINWIKQ